MPGAPAERRIPLFERDELSSTQDEAKRLLRAGERPPFAVRARVQSAGRGRRGREWASPPGGLWLSVVLPIAPPADPFLGLLAALSALEAVRAMLPPDAAARLLLKWPNDLVLSRLAGDDERKWGGVLGELESAAAPGISGDPPPPGPILIAGLGLDLAVAAGALPRIDPPGLPATSILAEFGRSPSPEEALPRILARLDARLALDRAPGGRARSVAAAAAATSTLGRPIRWQEGERTRTGRAIALAPDGGLEVELDPPAGALPESDRRRVLRAGEIEHLRSER